MVIAVDKKQAGIILRYIRAFLELKLLKPFVQSDRAESIELTNRISIEVHAASYKAVRGYTIVAAILEESAFWRVEGANPDREIYTAIRPAMGTIPGAMLLSISTPYSRNGVLYEAYREFFGREDEDILVWQASSLTMNPCLSPKMISREKAKDPSAARAEWDAMFRDDVEAFLPMEAIEKVVIPGRVELPYLEKFNYFAFADPSGGGGDHFALAIGHMEGEKIVQDVLRGRKDSDPFRIVDEYSEILKRYRIRRVTGDRYAGSWVKEAFAKQGISYKPAESTKSEIYLEALPLINGGLMQLLDNRELIKQLHLLERRRGSSGKDTVDHPKSFGGGVAHDDLANCSCGMAVIARKKRGARIRIFSIEPRRDEDDWD